MAKAKILTKQVAEEFIKGSGKVDLSTYTSIEDDAAEVLALHKRRLDLHGLKTLSDSSALALSKHKGPIYLVNLTHLSDSAASALACHEGHLQLWGLSEISDAGLSAMSARYDRGHCHWSATLTKRLKHLARTVLPKSDENCPPEWVDDAVVLSPPASEVRWISQTSLSKHKDIPISFFQWFTPFLPASHVREVDRGRSKTVEISEQAAALFVNNKAFFASVRAKSSQKKKLLSNQVVSHQLEKSASQAGLSKVELEAKLKRLGDLVKSGRLDLVAEMIAGFGEKWLYEALLPDCEVTEEGALKLGRPLKQFGSKGPLILLLAIAYMPAETERHCSLNREAVMRIEVGSDEIDVVAAMISPRLSGLSATCAHFSNSKLPLETAVLLAQARNDLDLSNVVELDDAQADALASQEGGLRLDGLTYLQATTASILAKNKGELSFEGITSLDEPTARALAECHSGLSLGLIDLPESIAVCLAKCRGKLQLPRIHQLTARAASALEQHQDTLILGYYTHSLKNGCELDASAADCLSRHRGPVILHQKKRLHTKTALALSACQHGLGLPDLEEIPLGDVGVKLCKALALGLPGKSMLSLRLKSLQADCAEALSAYRGHLSVHVEQWEESALIALAAHQGYLDIDPKKLTGPVARALSKRASSTSLKIHQYGTVSVDDDAAEALAAYLGQLTFHGSLNLSMEAARHLSKRASIKILRSKIKPTVREIFEQLGSWSEGEWKRTDASS
jgi:hypothetical protein